MCLTPTTSGRASLSHLRRVSLTGSGISSTTSSATEAKNSTHMFGSGSLICFRSPPSSLRAPLSCAASKALAKISSLIDVPNLYESRGYYTWRHPKTNKRYGLGRDREDAIDQAREANAALQQPKRLVQRVAAPARTLKDFLPAYRKIVEGRELKPSTRSRRKFELRLLEKHVGDVAIGPRQEDAAEITRHTAAFLATYEEADKLRMAKGLRSTLIDVYAAMASRGWLSVNPATVIKLKAPQVKRARLTLDDFWRIYEKAGELEPWAQNALALALVTLAHPIKPAPFRRFRPRARPCGRDSPRRPAYSSRIRDTVGRSVREWRA